MPKHSRPHGYYKRSSDGQTIQRYYCKVCKSTYSAATLSPLKWQKKRQINHLFNGIIKLKCVVICGGTDVAGESQTVAKKLLFLGAICEERNQKNALNYRSVDHIQFDELQTIEHTKCKPLSVAMAVSKNERKILGFRVSSMPATGHLATISRKKYGVRPDHRKAGLTDLFNDLSHFLSPTVTISSDECSFYNGVVKQYFPKAIVNQHTGKKSSVAGQGELKRPDLTPYLASTTRLQCFEPTLAA